MQRCRAHRRAGLRRAHVALARLSRLVWHLKVESWVFGTRVDSKPRIAVFCGERTLAALMCV
eukprot:3786197-Rhodomonas_salina.1